MKIDRARLFEAICELCPEIVLRCVPVGKWRSMREDELWFEILACILGSQVSFEAAQRAALRLQAEGLAGAGPAPTNRARHRRRLAECLTEARYRFPAVRALQICRTQDVIYGASRSIRVFLESESDPGKQRANIVSRVLGVGPKQASLFLRNVGFSLDLAVLDAHVVRYMTVMGLFEPRTSSQPPSFPTLLRYERVEAVLRDHAGKAGYALGHMDSAIWIAMRAIGRESSP